MEERVTLLDGRRISRYFETEVLADKLLRDPRRRRQGKFVADPVQIVEKSLSSWLADVAEPTIRESMREVAARLDDVFGFGQPVSELVSDSEPASDAEPTVNNIEPRDQNPTI